MAGTPVKKLDSTKKILVVDDEEDILSVYKMNLTQAGYDVETASDGEDAIELLKTNHYDLVISDMKMKKVHGVQLLRFIHKQNLGVEIILITGFSQLLEMKGAADLGCSAFLAKPVAKDDLIKAVEKGLESPVDESKAETLEGSEDDFARIAIEDFITGKSVDFSVYVKLQSGKYVKVAHTGEDIDLDRINTLKRKGLKEFWLTREDFKKYINFSVQMIGDGVFKKSDMSVKPKARLVNHVCAVASEQLRLYGVNVENIETAQKIVIEAIKGIEDEASGQAILEIIENQEPTPYAHCVGVAVLLALMTKVMAWSSTKNCHMLVLGGFFHDIGLLKLSKEVQQIKDPTRVSLDLRIQYEKHPLLGARELEQLKSLPKDVATIVAQHHENVDGTGFPRKLLRSDIFPLSRIVSLVETFSTRMMNAKPAERKNPLNILEKLVEELEAHFDESAILALRLAISEPKLSEAQKKYRNTAGN